MQTRRLEPGRPDVRGDLVERPSGDDGEGAAEHAPHRRHGRGEIVRNDDKLRLLGDLRQRSVEVGEEGVAVGIGDDARGEVGNQRMRAIDQQHRDTPIHGRAAPTPRQAAAHMRLSMTIPAPRTDPM